MNKGMKKARNFDSEMIIRMRVVSLFRKCLVAYVRLGLSRDKDSNHCGQISHSEKMYALQSVKKKDDIQGLTRQEQILVVGRTDR